jgi:type I restriction enzyme S subunit
MQSNSVPLGWLDCSLGNAIVRVVGGGTPSRSIPGYWVGNIPWASVKDFTDDTKWLSETEEHISPAGLASSTANLIEPGIPIVCTRMAVGRAAIPLKPIAINQDLKALYPHKYLDPRYLLILLNFIRPRFEALSIGSTVKGINVDQLLAVRVCFPPLDEQRRIVEILDTIDSTIAHTSSLIAKLKQMKAGLLHDLLTRGLDENGELRDAIGHPEQFKDSLLGRIPQDWEVTTLGTVVVRSGGFLQTGPFGSQLHAYEYVDAGVPVIMPQDIQDGQISDFQITHISPAKAGTLARHQVEINDVVFARRGDLERCAFIGKREIGWLCGTGCLLVRVPGKEIDCRWLAATYRHERSQRQILARAVGSTMVNLNSTLLSDLLIAKPTYLEQTAIVRVLDTYDKRIRTEQAYRDKLKLQKKGLMHDLLTGKVRVKDADKFTPASDKI